MAPVHPPDPNWEKEFQKIYAYVAWTLNRPDLAADVAQMTLEKQTALLFPCKRWLSDRDQSPFSSSSSCLELLVDGVPYPIDLDDSNTLDGVVQSIHEKGAGVWPEIEEGGSKKKKNKQYRLKLNVLSNTATSLELRETPGNPGSNLLEPVHNPPFNSRLFAMCRVIDEYRRRRKERLLPTEVDDEGNEQLIDLLDTKIVSAEDAAVEAEKNRKFHHNFRRLSEKDRIVLGMRFFLEYTLEETAKGLGCVVSGALYKERAALRRFGTLIRDNVPRLIVAVEADNLNSQREKGSWPEKIDSVLGSLSEGQELRIYAIRRLGTGQKPLFIEKIGQNNWRMRVKAALGRAADGTPAAKDCISTVFGVFEQVQSFPCFNARMMLWGVDAPAEPPGFRCDRNLLRDVRVQIMPGLDAKSHLSCVRLVKKLGATVD